MQTRTYGELSEEIQALLGSSFAAGELARIRSLVNRRANQAYLASNYWPRFLKVGEERMVTSNVIPYEEAGLLSIDKFLMIHRTQPFFSSSSQYYDFHTTGIGATLLAGSSNVGTAFVTYKATHDSMYGTGISDTADVPREWFSYIAYGAYSDALRMEGQTEKASIADIEAYDILTTELLRVDDQTPSFLKGRILTNANMQFRT